MFKVSYEECELIWKRKRAKNIIGENPHVYYICRKMNVVSSLHPEIREHYKRYIKEKHHGNDDIQP